MQQHNVANNDREYLLASSTLLTKLSVATYLRPVGNIQLFLFRTEIFGERHPVGVAARARCNSVFATHVNGIDGVNFPERSTFGVRPGAFGAWTMTRIVEELTLNTDRMILQRV